MLFMAPIEFETISRLKLLKGLLLDHFKKVGRKDWYNL